MFPSRGTGYFLHFVFVDFYEVFRYALGQYRIILSAEAVLKPLGGNCAVLPKGYLKTKNWIEFSAFQIYPKRFCGKNKNGNDIKRNGATMYRTIQHQMSIDDYLPPYEGELVQENRWVRLAQAIDWDAIEQEYSGHFAAGGKVAIPARMAFGVLVIRAACRTTDSETVEIVRESPYLQYFLGFDSFTYDVPFSSRSMERFRTRISPARVREAVALLRGFETNKGSKK